MRKSITKAVVTAALLLALPLVAQAAGLGKLTVISALGQPLNAEIEIVSLQPGEEDGLAAKLASESAFRQAGIEISAAFNDLRFSIERRGGMPIVRMRTIQPVNEPFLEVLVELSWASGRLVREYTFLLDPPEYKNKLAIAATPPPPPAAEKPAAPSEPAAAAATPPAAPPQGAPQTETKPAEPPPAAPGAAAPSEAAPAATPAAPSESTAPQAAPPQAASAAPPSSPAPQVREPAVYEVKKGDTLGQIARQNLPPGVTLNQMLLALYRANESAFIRKNVNLVRAGRILSIPDADAAGTIDRAEADRVVKEHTAQFNEYRSRLAAVPAPAEGAAGQQQAASGRIEAKPEPPAAPSQDQLRLSKVEPAKPGAAAGRAASEDDLAARDRALQEAQSRQADLEKNVTDLRKLLEMKNQQLAELEKKSAAKPAPTPAPVPEAAKPAPPPPPAQPAPQAAPQATPAAPASPPAPPVEAKKAETPKPEAKKPAPVAAPPAPQGGVMDEFIDNPLYGGLLLGVIVLLAVYGYIAWRRKKAAHAKFQDSVLGAAAAGALGTAPLGTPTAGGGGAPAAGAAAAAGGAPAATAAEGEEVDPIAEADVYMAYGRDAQAEEILKEALAKDAKRVPVHAKLLEIYAHRKDAKTFEQTALKLKQLTDGRGAEWDKAAGLGRSIDPQNSLYGGAAGAEAPAPAAEPAAAPAAAPTLDFDLGGGTNQPASAPDIALDTAPKEASAPALDFDLGGATAALPAQGLDQTQVLEKPEPSASPANIDFNLDLGGGAPAAAAPAAEAPKAASEPDTGLNFDINLDLGGGDKKSEAAGEKSAPALDLSAISFDLGGGAAPGAAAPAGGTDPKWQEVATKLDLAKAYEEMGDKDGARELLNEVMKDGDAAQKGTAQQLLAKLG